MRNKIDMAIDIRIFIFSTNLKYEYYKLIVVTILCQVKVCTLYDILSFSSPIIFLTNAICIWV